MAFNHPKDAATREEILTKVMLRNETEINRAVDTQVALMETRLEAEEAEEAEIIDETAD